MKKSLKWFSVLTTIGMVLVLLGGALVTKTDSGMGCGRSWPLCHGQLIPSNINAELLIELSHRVVSGSVGIMVLILSIWTWKAIGHIREAKFLSALAFIFLVVQGLIGAAAVVWGQSDFVLAIHFGVSLISFAAVFLLTLLIFEIDQKFDARKLVIDNRMKKHIYGITIYSFIVVYTGALVRHVNASLVCPSWPLCTKGGPFIPANFHQWVQMGHRLAAFIIFLWIGYIMILAIRHYRKEKIIFWGWIISFILVTCQAATGALVVFTMLNLGISLLHAFFISCLFGMLSYFCLLASRSKKNALALDKQEEKNVSLSPLTMRIE